MPEISALVEPRALMVLAFSFMVGSIPFGLVFTRGSGVDIRKTGSGNTGATNVLRSVGRLAALGTLLGDVLKGVAAVALAKLLGLPVLVQSVAGLMAVLGHDYSVFMRFRGGKGVATSLGAALGYAPLAGLITCIVWLGTVFAFRYSSLGALVSFAALPAVVWATGGGNEKIVISAIITVLLFVRHKENIKRLMKGTESRVGKKS